MTILKDFAQQNPTVRDSTGLGLGSDIRVAFDFASWLRLPSSAGILEVGVPQSVNAGFRV